MATVRRSPRDERPVSQMITLDGRSLRQAAPRPARRRRCDRRGQRRRTLAARPIPRLGQTPANLRKRHRHLILREPLHQLPQLVALGTHVRQPTDGRLDNLVATLIDSGQRPPEPASSGRQLAHVWPSATAGDACPQDLTDLRGAKCWRSQATNSLDLTCVSRVTGGAGGVRTHDLTDYEGIWSACRGLLTAAIVSARWSQTSSASSVSAISCHEARHVVASMTRVLGLIFRRRRGVG